MNFKISTLFVFVVLVSTNSISAQDAKPLREVGLQFSSFDFDGGSGFSAFFKKQKKENVYRRIRFFSGSVGFGIVQEEFDFDISAGIAIGREKRKSLDSKLVFYQGPEFAARLNVASFLEVGAQISITPSFGWVYGKITGVLVAHFEVVPPIHFRIFRPNKVTGSLCLLQPQYFTIPTVKLLSGVTSRT